jgi:hypothetical protein
MIKSKKGADKIMSLYWFAILLIVAGGVFAMVSVFYGYPYDVREVEVGILAEKVGICISNSGILNEEIFNEPFQNNFLENCGLNFETNSEISEYFISIELFEISDLENSVFYYSIGNSNWLSDCKIKDSGKYERLAKCAEERFYSTGSEEKQYLIKINSIVGKINENVK